MSDHPNPCPACEHTCQRCTYRCKECDAYYGSPLAARECAEFGCGKRD